MEKALVRGRWGLVFLLAALGLALEYLEHSHFAEHFSLGFLLDLFLKTFAFPLLVGSLLSLQNSKRKLSRIISQVDFQRAARAQLVNAQNWGELTTLLLQIPRTLLPLVGDALWLRNPATGKYEIIGSWSADGSDLEGDMLSPDGGPCLLKAPVPTASGKEFQLCSSSWNRTEGPSYQVYCLPLALGSRPMAVLQLFFPIGSTVQPDQLQRLLEAGPDLALAIERFQVWSALRGSPTDQETERHQIMRYLHDTVAPDLAYLRLKLDQFAFNGAQPGQSISDRDLKRLARIANQAYEKVRGSLSEMDVETPVDLPRAVEDFASAVGKRAGFQVEFHMDGRPVDLRPPVNRRVLYMVREALRNVEKHALAQKARVALLWRSDGLTIEISDDGRGFDMAELARRKGSYGLKILEECAEEIHARFHFLSSPESGTRMTIWLPLQDEG